MSNTALDNNYRPQSAEYNGLSNSDPLGNQPEENQPRDNQPRDNQPQDGQVQDKRKNLLSAFEIFNNVSSQLADTYRDMEQQVGSLNAQLHQVAEQRLQELKEKECVTQRLEELLNLLPAGVVVLGNTGIVNQCNPAAIEFLGEPLLGQLWRDIIKKNFSPQLDDGHEISLRDGRRISMMTRSLQGEPGQLILLTDLTQTRKLQKRLDHHRRLSEMGRMMSSLAHQIRTPLSAAMLYAGHLCDSQLTKEQYQRFSQKVFSRLTHLEQQIKDMLIFVRGDVKLSDTVSTAELFTQLEAAMEVCVNNSNSHYYISNTIPDIALQCNRESMVGALMNLVNNAIESVGKQAQLTITATLSDKHQVVFSVLDNGPGIPKEVLNKLEEPFFTTKSQGTGLGLAVVRAVAHAHHGEFVLTSESESGACARLILPVMIQQNTCRKG